MKDVSLLFSLLWASLIIQLSQWKLNQNWRKHLMSLSTGQSFVTQKLTGTASDHSSLMPLFQLFSNREHVKQLHTSLNGSLMVWTVLSLLRNSNRDPTVNLGSPLNALLLLPTVIISSMCINRTEMTTMPMQNSMQHATTAGVYSGIPSAATLRLFALRLAMRDQGLAGSGKSQERF